MNSGIEKNEFKKYPFGLSVFYFQLEGVLYKSYRQVLTPVDNLLSFISHAPARK
jgi:hypothetical protein